MATAKCNRCLGSADGKTIQEARSKINHAQGKSRGIPCGNSYNCVVEIKDNTKPVEKPKEETKSVEKKVSTPVEKPKKSKMF